MECTIVDRLCGRMPTAIRDPETQSRTLTDWGRVPVCGSVPAPPFRPRIWSAFGPREGAKR